MDNPDFEFPKIDESMLGWENGQHITIPGMFGGFDYFLEEVDGRLVLYAEQSSRMDHDNDSSSVFEVSMDESRLLEGEERDKVYRTELSMVLNRKCWYWYEKNNTFSKLYAELWEEYHSWVLENWVGEDLGYYLRAVD